MIGFGGQLNDILIKEDTDKTGLMHVEKVKQIV